MSLALYDVSIPLYINGLQNLLAIIDKSRAHAGEAIEGWLEARLIADMHPLARQIQMVSDAAKGGAARLAGQEPPSMPDTETTLDELRARLEKTLAFVESIRPDQVNGREGETVELKFPNGSMSFTAKDFLLNFSLPNFYFHLVTTYGLLRKEGAPIGKMDFLAGARQPA
ncbi:MAG: DUF1993 family protein [Caulobacter sp.]